MTSSLSGNNNFPKSFGDSRDDLGYGRLSAKFHKERLQGGTAFPYIEPPEDLSAIDIEEELLSLVNDKLAIPRDYDPLPTLDSEGQYYISGNSKLSEAGDSMSPIPGLYKNRIKTGSGPAASYPPSSANGFSTRIRPTGSKYGYSTMHGDTEDSDEPVYTLDDLVEKQLDEIREYVRNILLMELR